MIRAALLLAAALPMAAPAQEVTEGSGAVLRGLDKITGALTDLDIPNGGTEKFGRLTVSVSDCRYPSGNPAGDAFAHVTISTDTAAAPMFSGWMIASSPALDALDHPRYDVWVLRCMTS